MQFICFHALLLFAAFKSSINTNEFIGLSFRSLYLSYVSVGRRKQTYPVSRELLELVSNLVSLAKELHQC